MQITQFVVGASYAALHPFISYTIRIPVIAQAAGVVAEAVSTVADAVDTAATAATAGGIMSWIRSATARAVGEEAVEKKVVAAAPAEVVQEVQWREQRVGCMDTSGEVFAITLNVVYLAPLT